MTNRTTFYTADTHHCHKRIIELSRRPFACVEEMDETMIANWNATVSPTDIVRHLGDFATFGRGREKIQEIFGRLNGEKHLVIGNHDRDNETTLSLPWASMQHQAWIEDGGRTVFACHYPMLTWPGARRGAYHLYGHVHGDVPGTNRSLDVGVDQNDFRPITLDEAIARMSGKPQWPETPERWRS